MNESDEEVLIFPDVYLCFKEKKKQKKTCRTEFWIHRRLYKELLISWKKVRKL